MANIAVLAYSSSISYLIRNLVGPQVMFVIQGCLTGLAAVFIMIFIKETSHLTDKEKKALYETRKSTSTSFGNSYKKKTSEIGY